MYIYINPSLLDADRDYLDYLGLHGYYLVTSVQSKITPSSFDVSITALHEGVEFNNQKLLPSADLGQYEFLRPEDPPRGFRLKTNTSRDVQEATKAYTDAENKEQKEAALSDLRDRLQERDPNTAVIGGERRQLPEFGGL